MANKKLETQLDIRTVRDFTRWLKKRDFYDFGVSKRVSFRDVKVIKLGEYPDKEKYYTLLSKPNEDLIIPYTELLHTFADGSHWYAIKNHTPEWVYELLQEWKQLLKLEQH